MPFTLTQQRCPDPTVEGSGEDGWKLLPDIAQATLHPKWAVNNEKGAYLPVYQTNGLDMTEVTRAVIILQGKASYISELGPVILLISSHSIGLADWNAANNALSKAVYNDPSIKRSEISITCPCFLAEADLSEGAAQDGQLLWGKTNWISGSRNVGPDSVTGVSSFDVLDALVAYYMDRNLYPNLKVLVVGGHSAGGQMAQRYAILRPSTDDDDRLHFWIANPGSLCWLTPNRPIPNNRCEGVDAFKYGLASNFPAYASKNARALGREGIVKRYHSRTLNYAWGLKDEGNGDTRAQAQTQGRTHLERGRNFVAMLEDMGGIPSLTTVNWVPGVSHSGEAMMASDAGIDKVGFFFAQLSSPL
ncbi:hypothetical protein IW261DRAFT_1565659 [Armillaria novae-zelandiae]|uniref:Uncharacterized protein n=1 Tax=Armillaria novae-zelandiae TaxID=153914 RepID=A0AA39P6K7_9AGAR|nr:hypothetical protein IW261DRAFT_1565659 [Armillaria novae-zelandiae]